MYLQESQLYPPISKHPSHNLVTRYRRYAIHDIVKKMTLVSGRNAEIQAPRVLYIEMPVKQEAR